MQPVTREWIAGQGACGEDYERVRRLFGVSVDITRANIDQARAAGINLLWAGCHLVTSGELAEFITFTVGQRTAALATLAGITPPFDASALRDAGDVERQRWLETDADASRSAATALQDAARDLEMSSPTPAEAEEAAHAAQRAISYAGEDQAAAKLAQEEWLAGKVMP